MESLLNEIKRINYSNANVDNLGGIVDDNPIARLVTTTQHQQPPIAEHKPSSSDEQSISSSSASSPLPPPSPEDLEQMVAFLLQLDELRSRDPAQYSTTLQQLGLAGPDFDITKSPDSDPLNTINESLRDVKESFIRSKISPGKFNLPDGSSLLGEKGLESKVKAKQIIPEPGFVIKTKRMRDEKKIFINMCQHEDVDAPSIKKKLDDKGEPVEGMNIPMSVGPGIVSKDKSDVSCIVYDIIVHPDVISDSKDDSTGKYRDFVCQLGIQSLEQKYKEELDKRYKLPKLKYLGETVSPQQIQDRKNMPKIEEIGSSRAAGAKATSGVKSKHNNSSGKSSLGAEAVFVPHDVELIHRLYWGVNISIEDSSTSNDETEIPLVLVMNDYIDPVEDVPSPETTSIVFTATLMSSTVIDSSHFDIQISPYKLIVKIEGYKQILYHLPCAVDPTLVTSVISSSRSVSSSSGDAGSMILTIGMPLDRTLWEDAADVGSRPWLMAAALQDDTHEKNPYTKRINAHNGSNSNTGCTTAGTVAATTSLASERLPEDKFHIKLPENVDKYTGVKMDGEGEDVEFPEDRFHKSDASSSYYINQREESIKEKRDRHEKEKAERANDPNVEYVDTEDFKPGGKYGPKDVPPLPPATASDSIESSTQEELKKASEILLHSLANQQGSDMLSSNLWAELL